MMKYTQSMRETYNQVLQEQNLDYDTEPEDLNESRLLRGASALVFASRSKSNGDKVVQSANKGKDILNRFKPDQTTSDRLQVLNDAMGHMFDAIIENRKQIGNLVGVALSSALISERSTKELQKIMKRQRR